MGWLSTLFRDDELHRKVDDVSYQLDLVMSKITEMENKMSAAMDLLMAEITDVRGVVDSTLLLIQKLVDKINGAATLEEVQAFVAELEVEEQKLADAVAANP
jgi:hypothetical protein